MNFQIMFGWITVWPLNTFFRILPITIMPTTAIYKYDKFLLILFLTPPALSKYINSP